MNEQAAQRSENSEIFLELAANRSASEDGLHIPAISKSQASDERTSGVSRRIYRICLLVAVPLFVFGLLTGLGIMAVTLAAEAAEKTNQELAFHSARDLAVQFEMQVSQSLIPANTLRHLIEQNPSWPYWQQHFDSVAAELMTTVTNHGGSIWNIQIQPFGQIAGIYPLRPEDKTQIGRDLISDPARRSQIYPIIQSQNTSIAVSFAAQGFNAAFVRSPIFISGTSNNETFGYNFRGANFSALNISYPPVPFPSGPPAAGYPFGYATQCPICFNTSNLTAIPPVPSSRFWGCTVSMINLVEVTSGTDSRLAKLGSSSEGYKYKLTKPLNSTASFTIVESGGAIELDDAVSVPVAMPGEEWTLFVEPLNGTWYPFWYKPLTGAVVAISFVISALVFLAIFFYLKQKDQLAQTNSLLAEMKVVNKALEDSTKSQLSISRRLSEEVQRSDNLLFRMLPPFAAAKLRKGEAVEAEDYPSVSILFTDIVGFTEISARCTPMEVCQMLDQLYLAFDSILKSYPELFKVETIGDAYMVVANLSGKCHDHADIIIQFGLRIQDATTSMVAPDGTPLRIRLGINSGHVVGGVIGSEMPHFCLFGNTVNTASRMESHGLPCRVHISQACHDAIVDKSRFVIEDRGMIDIKGRGLMHTYLVAGIHRYILESQHLALIRLPDLLMPSKLLQAGRSGLGRRHGVRQSMDNPMQSIADDLDEVLENKGAEFSPENAFDKLMGDSGDATDEMEKVLGSKLLSCSKQVVFLGGGSAKEIDSTSS